MAAKDLGPLDWRTAIVDAQGRPTAEFQRRWDTQRGNNALIGALTIGEGPPTGTPADGDQFVDASTDPFTYFVGDNGEWHQVGAVAFTDLTDTPDDYAGAGGQLVAVKADDTGLEFRTLASADVPLLVVGFILNTGATGTNVGPQLVAPRAGGFTKCKVVTKASDPAVPLTFRIRKNGTSIFSTNPTLAAATAPGTLNTFAGLIVSPLPVAADDLFTIDVTSGSAAWQATIQLE